MTRGAAKQVPALHAGVTWAGGTRARARARARVTRVHSAGGLPGGCRGRIGRALGRALGLAVIAAAAGSAGCAPDAPVLGVILPLSGPDAEAGRQAQQAVAMALEESTAVPAPAVLLRDGRGEPDESARLVGELAEAGADAIVGPLSTASAAAAAIMAEARGVPLVAPAASGPFTQGNRCAFRFGYGDAPAGRALARFARRTLRLGSVVVATDLTASDSVGFAAAFAEEFRALQGLVLDERGYFGELGSGPPGALLADAVAAGAEGVLVAGPARDVERLVEQADDEVLARLALLGGDGWDDDRLRARVAGRVAGAWHTAHFSPDEPRPRATDFTARFVERTGETPGSLAALCYDATRAALAALASGEPGSARDRIASIRRFEGVTGRVSLDLSGEPSHKEIVVEQQHDPTRPRFVERLRD